MRGSAIAASLALTVIALSAAPAFAQTLAAPAKPAAAPAQPPAPAPTLPPAQPPAPFPAGAKIAFFNPQAVFQASADGRAAVGRVNALIEKKQKENADKAKLSSATSRSCRRAAA